MALIFFVTVTAVFLFIKWAGPYGQEYLPQWTSKGNDIVTAIDSWKEEHGVYREDIPVAVETKDIPGCKRVEYQKFTAEDGSEYYTIRMFIHFRGLVICDSRKIFDENSSRGSYKILDSWMWTKD